jgi:hypothetical protein
MSKGKLKASCLILIISAIMILAGCSGGGGGSSSSSSSSSGSGAGTGTALSVADEVSVVEAQASAGKIKAMKIGKIFLSPSDVPADSDYNNDRQEVYVHERSAEAFNIINEILCSMGQSRYDEMVNLGDYKAQIDTNLCNQDKDSASGAGESSQDQSSGSTAPEYEMWTVNSSRADNSSPHIVKVWMHEKADGDMPAKVIFIGISITEGTSDTNPYGMFEMNFKSHPVIDGVVDTSTELFKGYLKTEEDTGTDQILLKFVCQGDEGGAFSEQVVLNRAADGSGGSGTVSTSNDWDGDISYDIAFDTTYFLREDIGSGDQMCFSRTTFDETVWDYGLYDSNGARVNRNSGFSIKKDDAYGWIGYYGLWLPEDTSVSNGDTVYRVTYGQGGENATPYTVVKKDGRLKKHTRGLTSLNKIKNIPLNYWTPDGNFNVKWDGSDFFKFAKQNQGTFMFEDMADGDPDKGPLDLSAITFGDLNFHSQSLGGQVRIKLSGCVWDVDQMMYTSCVYPDPADETQVVFFKEDVVFPGDTVPAALTCYDNCPKYTEADGGISGADPIYASDGMTSHDYSFSSTADDMILKEGVNLLVWVGTADGLYQFGAMSGPLFDATDPANINALDCNWDGDDDPATNAQTCGWKAHSELSEFYTWETGPNSWNQFTVLKDADGNVLEFQPPLQVQYTHSEADHKYDGVTFYLEYSGFGNLHGIPGTCIDTDTGAVTTCGPDTRWVPEFSIADGSEATDGTNDYLIKALRKEQRMSGVELEACSGLSLSSYDLPLIDDWTDPAIGAEPVVTNAPAVIGGVVQ